MDVVQAFYQALNSGDAAAIAALYAPDCTVEYVFEDGAAVYDTRDVVAGKWAEEIAARAGGVLGGHRIDVSRIAGVQTGWGWVRADWVSASTAGYSHFWVEDGLIRKHRSIRAKTDVGHRFPPAPEETDARHRFLRPVVGIGAVILTDEGQVVLVKRRNEPLAGQWSLPGGGLELGESLEAGTAREVLEETGLIVTIGPMIETFDRILLNDDGSVKFHFVLVDYLCRPRGGKLQSGSDVEAVTLADPGDLAEWRVAEKVRAVVARALELQRTSRGTDE
jgi:ADP-ribose pyrophosphatase YjhB (NUDIX family)